ncbi:YvcK family protein [Erysipelotrichaceae bacterium OttesenSCG-928-M19]|nr:YvcK family protein [Erysipelotrichaceae bacterium OttesenSCG-928-M19]
MSKTSCKVVCIGGGSGLSHFVKGIKDINYIELKCIVTVADNGGSSGILKEELKIPAVGDLRNVLISLSNVPEQLEKVMNYRFVDGGLKGHSLGNLVIAGAIQSSNQDIVSAFHDISDVFNVRGEIIPSSTDTVDIKATLFDNSEVYGEKNIGVVNKKIQTIEYITPVKASKEAVVAIEEADLIIYSIGSLYTSLIPNLIIPEIKEAIKNSKAQKVYFANLMSQPGETDNYSLSEHIDAINRHLGFVGIDTVIVNNQKISKRILDLYQIEDAYPVANDFGNIAKEIKILKYDIAKIEDDKIMHSPEKINKMFRKDLKCLFQEK